MTKVSDEFVKGKHNIGWVDGDFSRQYGDEEIVPGALLPFKKLEKPMNDFEILKELNIKESTIGDVLALLDTATDEMKDGYSNIFYIKGHLSRVVIVFWFVGEWDVRAWLRDGITWRAGIRVFSPATENSTLGPVSSESGMLGTSVYILLVENEHLAKQLFSEHFATGKITYAEVLPIEKRENIINALSGIE